MTRAIADTLMVSAVPAFVAIVLVIFMRKRKKSQAVEQEASKDSDAQHHVMIEM